MIFFILKWWLAKIYIFLINPAALDFVFISVSVSALPCRLLFLKPNCQVAHVIDYVVKLWYNKIELFDKLIWFRKLSKLDCLYESLWEFHSQMMCSIHFHHRVTQGNHVFHISISQIPLYIQEGVKFPLGDLALESWFVAGTCGNYSDLL